MSQAQAALIDQYRQLHRESLYGTSSEEMLGYIQMELADLGYGNVKTILDYGCGQSRLVDWLAKLNDAIPYRYDPAIPAFSTIPVSTADLVINTDVLEHILEDHIDETIEKIKSISKNVFFNICTVKAVAHLPNGENAHCTVRPESWWESKLKRHFDLIRKVTNYRPGATCSYVTWPKA